MTANYLNFNACTVHKLYVNRLHNFISELRTGSFNIT